MTAASRRPLPLRPPPPVRRRVGPPSSSSSGPRPARRRGDVGDESFEALEAAAAMGFLSSPPPAAAAFLFLCAVSCVTCADIADAQRLALRGISGVGGGVWTDDGHPKRKAEGRRRPARQGTASSQEARDCLQPSAQPAKRRAAGPPQTEPNPPDGEWHGLSRSKSRWANMAIP
ncbi:hypothetical protein DAI22_02g345366 [Oryza sativa Japonica Group]|nr:hypothetical protein DAI22_02g345366 [Oryza sativa Japonica Group]